MAQVLHGGQHSNMHNRMHGPYPTQKSTCATGEAEDFSCQVTEVAGEDFDESLRKSGQMKKFKSDLPEA